MKKITKRFVSSEGYGIFHDSRQDVRTLLEIDNILKDKVNELIDYTAKLEARIKQLEGNV